MSAETNLMPKRWTKAGGNICEPTEGLGPILIFQAATSPYSKAYHINASLASAAPELLAALEGLMEIQNVGASATDEAVALMNAALAAIAKAKGT